MNDQQRRSSIPECEIRGSVRHWISIGRRPMPTILKTEHRIYHEDAVLEYPQSGERTRSRRNIQNQRASQPSKQAVAVRRIIGGVDLWITEFVLTYDSKPSYTVSIMEFRGDKVARETQYFADPFVGSRRARSSGRTDGHLISRRGNSPTTPPICGLQHNCREQRLTPDPLSPD